MRAHFHPVLACGSCTLHSTNDIRSRAHAHGLMPSTRVEPSLFRVLAVPLPIPDSSSSRTGCASGFSSSLGGCCSEVCAREETCVSRADVFTTLSLSLSLSLSLYPLYAKSAKSSIQLPFHDGNRYPYLNLNLRGSAKLPSVTVDASSSSSSS